MGNGFYTEGLENHGLTVVTPSTPEQEAIHRIIYNELILGKVNPSSVRDFYGIAQGLWGSGADAVLLGCTELELLTRDYPDQPRFLDSTRIHANAAWEIAMGMASL
jgi:aspartate racemase